MRKKQTIDELSDAELKQFLHRRKRQRRLQRLQRLKENGRVVDIAGLSSPDADLSFETSQAEEAPDPEPVTQPLPQTKSRWIMNKVLLLVEITAVIGFIIIGLTFWNTTQELNQELAQVQRTQGEAFALPTPSATPVIDVVILPGGHKPPVPGQSPVQGEAGDIPAHLLPVINAYVPPPAPTPASVQARRIQIPRINIDAPVVQGMYDWEQLKRGVAQKIDSAAPGEVGNMALAAHNDIYGELFRDLDQLSPGDEIIVSSGVQSFTYIVRETRIVEPTEVSVLEPTDFASTTLISCYPYRVNTQRIVVFADLANS
jgi:sortase A